MTVMVVIMTVIMMIIMMVIMMVITMVIVADDSGGATNGDNSDGNDISAV